jgi:peptidoglycan/LPS O-acetylase OafA/YrhL
MSRIRVAKTPALEIFPALTGIRTVAAMMVYLAHFNPFSAAIFGKALPAFVNQCHVGVTIFFVLSGFLICYRYHDAVITGKLRQRHYLVNRFARIYPLYFIVTVVVFLPFFCHCVFGDRIGTFLLNISFLRGFFTDYLFTGDSSGWSLTVEEMFYFLFPLIMLASRRVRLSVQPLLLIGLGLTLVAIFSNVSIHGFFATRQFLFEYTFFGRCVEFYTGIALALYLAKRGIRVATGRPFATLGGLCWIIAGIAGLAVNKHYIKDPGWFLFDETLINNFLLPPGIALLFYGLLCEHSLLRKCLGSSPFILLGKSSYAFYLVHVPLFGILYYRLGQKPLPVLLIILLIAFLLYIWVEQPLSRLIRGQARKPAKTLQ